jgi:hypothetical protein
MLVVRVIQSCCNTPERRAYFNPVEKELHMNQPAEDRGRKELETKKLELLVKIHELQLELQKTNSELYKRGLPLVEALCW